MTGHYRDVLAMLSRSGVMPGQENCKLVYAPSVLDDPLVALPNPSSKSGLMFAGFPIEFDLGLPERAVELRDGGKVLARFIVGQS